MLKIAFVVGKSSDSYPKKITSRSLPTWLKKGFVKFEDDNVIYEDNEIMVDVAMASYINYYHGSPKGKTVVTLFEGSDIGEGKVKLKQLNEQDVIFVFFDATNAFHCSARKTCPVETNRLRRMLRTTTAFVCVPPDFNDFINDKTPFYRDLHRAGIPVAPYRGLQTNSIRTVSDANKLKQWIMKKGWKGIIIKPAWGAYGLGIKIYKNMARTSPSVIYKHFAYLRKKKYPRVVIQEFVPSFGKNYEVRTFWLDGQYKYFIATQMDNPGANIKYKKHLPHKIVQELKSVGKMVLQSIPQYPYKIPLIRIDFGCCLSVDNCLQSYFVNEVESMPADTFPAHTKFPIVEKFAQVLYKFALARARKNQRNIKGRKSTKKFKNVAPCKVKRTRR